MWAVLGVSGHAVFRVFLNTGSRTTGESPQACAVGHTTPGVLRQGLCRARPVPSSGDTARLLPAPCEVMETSSATIPSPGSCPPGSPVLLSWSGHWGCPAEPVGSVAYPAAGLNPSSELLALYLSEPKPDCNPLLWKKRVLLSMSEMDVAIGVNLDLSRTQCPWWFDLWI